MHATSAEREFESVLQWADIKLRDAENVDISRHTRIEAAFDSIYARLSVLARRAGHPEPSAHPSERVMLQGAVAAGLNDHCLCEVMELHLTVADRRHNSCAHTVSLPTALALGRHLEELVKG
jgi:hypothetical protein